MVQKLVQANYPYLYLRGTTYYFRFILSPTIRSKCPSLPREIKRSLRTDSFTDAVAMVSEKIPLLNIMKECACEVLLVDIYQKLADFTKEISGWVNRKLQMYMSGSVDANGKSTTQRKSSLKLDTAWDQFVQWKSWTDKQAKANQRIYDNLKFFLGNVPVDRVSKKDLKSALERISKLPQRNKKGYKLIPLRMLVKLPIPLADRISSKYVKEHLALCQSFFSRYLKNEMDAIDISPTEGIKWIYEINRYGSFTDAEVRNALSKSTQKPEWFKWFLLLTVYSGARRSEIAGLTKSDIKFCDDTQRYYFVIKEGKTKAAKRAVPIHHELLKSGLLQWIAGGEEQIFDTAYRNLNRVTDLFGSLLEKNVNDYGERLVFHSIRHTFITKARAAGIGDVLVQQVVGHEKSGAGQTDRYTHTFQLKDVLKVVDSISYS